jgi:hypothetical protein
MYPPEFYNPALLYHQLTCIHSLATTNSYQINNDRQKHHELPEVLEVIQSIGWRTKR